MSMEGVLYCVAPSVDLLAAVLGSELAAHPAINTCKIFYHLYMHRTVSGAKKNQFHILASGCPNQLGETVVSDWPIFDKRGQGAKVRELSSLT
jgi:hypothetical protein